MGPSIRAMAVGRFRCCSSRCQKRSTRAAPAPASRNRLQPLKSPSRKRSQVRRVSGNSARIVSRRASAATADAWPGASRSRCATMAGVSSA